VSRKTGTAWGLTLVSRGDWRTRAACSPDVAELFWPVYDVAGRSGKFTASTESALRICSTCPVRQQCFDYELRNPAPHPRVAGGRVWDAKGRAVG
jgi:hypothetical protein